MSFKEKIDESKMKELADYKRKKNYGLAGLIYGGVLVTGSIIVANSPNIGNETLQLVAQNIQSMLPLIGGFVGLDAVNYVNNKKRFEQLSQQIEEERLKEGQKNTKESEKKVMKR